MLYDAACLVLYKDGNIGRKSLNIDCFAFETGLAACKLKVMNISDGLCGLSVTPRLVMIAQK